LKWMSRIDYLVKNNEIFFLEVNTIPWMTEVSILPQAWKLTWRNLTELVDEVIKI
jgi:D-alanine-D-alanine ligase